MSKQQRKHAHNPRNPNLCRVCLTNTIGKTRLAYGHTVCQACSRLETKPTGESHDDANNTTIDTQVRTDD
jgi:hypothetical protein